MSRWPKENAMAHAVECAAKRSVTENKPARAVPLCWLRITQFVLVAVLMFGSQSASRAGFVFAFNTSGTDQVFFAGTNAIIDVPIYLVQTDGENRLSSVGLFSSGASVSYAYGSGTAGSATVNTATLASTWNDTISSLVSLLPDQVLMEGIINDFNLPARAISDAVLLGTIKFQAGSEGNVTNLQLSLNGVTPFANTLVNLSEVTPITFRQAQITVVATPEPASLCLFTGACVVGLGWRSRKRRKTRTDGRKSI